MLDLKIKKKKSCSIGTEDRENMLTMWKEIKNK